MKVAWPNESIELWFLLHFQEYSSNNGRVQYINKSVFRLLENQRRSI
ncbi:MAG: RloB domain-containing protein [Firmicutes bacterium]|nr:RloB domain-containing protein [Bacillota bacterium]